MTNHGYILADIYGNFVGNTAKYGGMYTYNKSVVFGIIVADVYHAYHLISAGDIIVGMLSGWTFNAGRTVDSNILNEINPSGNILQIECSVAHNLSTGDLVVLTNMNNAAHNGPTRVTQIDATKFNCQDIVYVGNAGASAGIVDVPAFLQANTGSSGNYHANFSIDGTGAGANKNWKFELFTNITPNDNMVTERTTTATLAAMSATGHIVIADGDKVWLAGKNSTDTTDYTVKNFNFNIHKLN